MTDYTPTTGEIKNARSRTDRGQEEGMSKYTEDWPFMAEGVTVWRDSEGEVCYNHSRFEASALAVAMHAFIEAEREGWYWTDDDHTEARNGRWRVTDTNSPWIQHADFGTCAMSREVAADPNFHESSWARTARVRLDEYIAWRDAQNQPEEPTEPGARIECKWRTGKIEQFVLVDQWRSVDDGDPMGGWHQTQKAEAVTILSRGMDQPEVYPLAHVKVDD